MEKPSFSWLEPSDFGKLHIREHREARDLPPLVDQRQEALPASAPSIDPTPAFLALTDAIDRLASRVHDIESLPIYGLSGKEVIKALRSGQAQRNALSLDE